MKNIKLKSLLKEDEMKAKSMWNRLDADSREDILLRFVKNPADAEKMVMKTWDTLPDNIAGNKDFQDAITDQKGLRETNIKMVDQGYAQNFYKIKSDIISSWSDTNTIEADIEGYLKLAHESGGPKLVREVMNSILAGVNNAKPLLRQLKGTSPADVDLAENETIKLTSFLKEEKQIPFKFGNLDMFVGQQGKYIYVFPKSMRQFDDFMLKPGAPSVPEAIESMLDKKGIEVTKVNAPSNVPGFAFVSKASLEDIATALGAKGIMNAPMAYGEEEAIKMIWDDPGGKIESKLKGINGYESIALGGPWDGAFGKTYPPAGISIYFKNKKAAIYGAAVLSNLVPGPEYEKMIKVGNGYAAIELEA